MYFNLYYRTIFFYRLLMMKRPLPLPGQLSTFWSRITKVIDGVHIDNHKRPAFKIDYHPSKVKNILPDANLMICEETYAWAGRFKKVKYWLDYLN